MWRESNNDKHSNSSKTIKKKIKERKQETKFLRQLETRMKWLRVHRFCCTCMTVFRERVSDKKKSKEKSNSFETPASGNLKSGGRCVSNEFLSISSYFDLSLFFPFRGGSLLGREKKYHSPRSHQRSVIISISDNSCYLRFSKLISAYLNSNYILPPLPSPPSIFLLLYKTKLDYCKRNIMNRKGYKTWLNK